MDKQVTVLFSELAGLGADMPRFFSGQTVEAHRLAGSEKDLAYLVNIGAVALAVEGKAK